MLFTDFNSGRTGRIGIACVILAALTAACSSTTPTPVVTIAPRFANVDSGGQVSFTVSVSNGPAATCMATGGTLAQTGSSLVYTAPVASARFDIRCESAGQSATVTVDVSGPITIEYAGGVPEHASQPASDLPILFIGQYGPGNPPSFGGQNIPGFVCDRPTWLGGNSWRCSFPLVPPSTVLVRVHDGPRNVIEPATNGHYCRVITFSGVAALPQPDLASGCVAKFR
jgi:hypothetical protein